MKTPTDTLHAAKIYAEEYSFLHEAQDALADSSLPRDTLREKYRALVAEHAILLRKMVKITGISDKAQLKLLNANETIETQQQKLALLNRVGQMFSSTVDLDRVLTSVLNQMHELLDILATSFWLRDNESGELVCKESIGPGREAILGWRLPVGQGIVGKAALSGELIMVADTRLEPSHYKDVDVKTGIEIRSILSLPFRSRGEVIGVLNLVDRKPNRFTQSDLQLVEPIAAAAASAVENARLYMLAQQEIAERARTEEALRQAKDEAESANRAKSLFLSNMSHELRAPLNAILGFARMLSRDPGSSDILAYADTITRSGEHLLSLINQVLDLSKIEAGRLTVNLNTCDLPELLEDLNTMFALKAKQKHLMLRMECAPDVPRYVSTDEVKLRQILINLLSNAIKFTERGGITVRVKGTRIEEQGARDEEQGAREEEQGARDKEQDLSPSSLDLSPCTVHLQFEIEDTGPGIAPEEMATLFEAFTQTATGRKAQEGTGLGLAISRQFARLMGGDIRVSSTSAGTTFTAEVMVEVHYQEHVSSASRQPFPSRRAIALEAGQPPYRLLIVDDRPENRQLLVALLAPFGFELREAANGQQALKIWREWRPHLLFMDIRMPVLDGQEATLQIRREEAAQQQQRTKIIILSASIMENERSAILAAGCDGFLHKPFRDEDIFTALEQHLGIKFVYGGKDNTFPTQRENCRETRDDLAAKLAEVPSAPLEKLASAAEHYDVTRMLRIIGAIRAEHPTAAEHLECLAQDFEYENILALLRKHLTPITR